MTETEAIRQNYELGVMAGEAREQQRIIKLIQEHIELQISDDTDMEQLEYHEDTCGLCKNLNGLGVALELIKGKK